LLVVLQLSPSPLLVRNEKQVKTEEHGSRMRDFQYQLEALFKSGPLLYDQLLAVLRKNASSPIIPILEEIVANLSRSFILSVIPDDSPLPLLRPSFSMTTEDLLTQSASQNLSQLKDRKTTDSQQSTFEGAVTVLEFIYANWLEKKPDGDLLVLLRTTCIGLDYAGANQKIKKEPYVSAFLLFIMVTFGFY
jgi:hypothetical protein